MPRESGGQPRTLGADDIVLLIEDDAAVAQAVRNALPVAPDCTATMEWLRSCAQAVARFSSPEDCAAHDNHRIVAMIVDLQLPDSSGIDTFERLYAAAPHVPLLLLCSPEDETDAKGAVRRGAQDYLLKSHLNSYVLQKTLSGVLARAAILEALFDEQERAQVTLASIGDAVISTDVDGRVTYLNVMAERLTGWKRNAAMGRPFGEVVKVIDADTRTELPDPMKQAMRQNKTVGLSPNSLLIRHDGIEASIEDSTAPIHDRRGTVTGAVIVFHDVSNARALSLKMAYLAQHDSLTGLPNRALFHDRLTQGIGMARRHELFLAVLYLDLDRFKNINDSLGHPMGDKLLQAVAQRLKDCLRASDTVSRQGGDEFVILLAEMPEAGDAEICAEKLLETMRTPYLLEHELFVTASIGIALYPQDGLDPDTLLENADSAMYEAKGRGRNNYQSYRAELNSGAADRRLLENGLRYAIDRQEFILHYQPTVDLVTGAIAGVEALLRWQHPARGLLHPAHFIPIAEESGLIVPIGRWVMREACRQAASWRDMGLPAFTLSVNVSAVEPQSRRFVSQVSDILSETGFDPARLELEITETFLMQDSISTTWVLKELKAIGVRFALDDFGTGYSSLSHMRRYPIDALKVDKSFVQELDLNTNGGNVVSAIINMGRSLQMRVIAEGVESQDQLRYLRQHHCPEGQGNWFSHPLAADDFEQLLSRGISVESLALPA